MLRGRELGILAAVLGALSLSTALAAQTRVKLQRNVGLGVLETAIAELTVPSRMGAAQQRLWQIGEPAVPLLAAEVERGGAGESAARFVLELLGCEAAAAVPVLKRIVDDPQTAPAHRARVAATLAKIDGPPMILQPIFNEGLVVELDLDGNERRRVAVESPWGAWPLPDDRVGYVSFSKGEVVSVDWQGQSESLRKLESSSGSVVAFGDDFAGDVVFTTWQDKGELIRRNAAGDDVWKASIDAARVERGFGDELIVLTRAKPRIAWYSHDGEELRSLPLPQPCHNLQPLRGGGYLVASRSTKIFELATDGSTVGELTVDSPPNDAVRLRDGRTIVSTDKSLVLFDAAGKQLWSKPVAYCGPLFVRGPAREVK